MAFVNVELSGYNLLEFNNGPGIRVHLLFACQFVSLYNSPLFQVVGSQMDLLPGGRLSFHGNNAETQEGRALYMQDFGQIKLYSNSSMEFINNTGR